MLRLSVSSLGSDDDAGGRQLFKTRLGLADCHRSCTDPALQVCLGLIARCMPQMCGDTQARHAVSETTTTTTTTTTQITVEIPLLQFFIKVVDMPVDVQ